MKRLRLRHIVVLLATIAALLVLAKLATSPAQRVNIVVTPSVDLPLTEEIARTVSAALKDKTLRAPKSGAGDKTSHLAYVALRSKGLRVAGAWSTAPNYLLATSKAITQAKAELSAEQKNAIDAVEIDLPYGFKDVDLKQRRRQLTDIKRGIFGLEVSFKGTTYRFPPTQLLASNQSFTLILRQVGVLRGGRKRNQLTQAAKVQIFQAAQFLVFPANERGVRLTRGNQIVPISDVNKTNVAALAKRMSDWMLNSVHADGRLTYKYWPSQSRESEGNNMIRQWMGTVCLGRIARYRNDATVDQLKEKNIQYNLHQFYKQEGPLGLIEHQQKVKLGAIALAAMAITEFPGRDHFAPQEAALGLTIDSLWNENGAFNTFYRPRERNDVQNFYPGEALLYWATRYRQTGDDKLLNKIMRSFHYYRDWHRQHRNPAFIPWHTQAYALIWQKTKDKALRDFIFEMNDWLLNMQQWKKAPTEDTRGRFFWPGRGYGPPHASATGVYLEGLIDAFAVAKAAGEKRRAERYRTAILRGLRSIMQLEFADEIDMFYVRQPARVRGGIRTTVYDNTIRVDNIQHALMAILKILDEANHIFVEKDGPSQ